MFLIFISMTFIVSPILTLILIASPWGYLGLQWIYYLLIGLNLLSSIPFLIFAGSAKQYFSGEQVEAFTRLESELNEGPAWDTDLNKSQIKQIATKRNLALVIDCLPAMAVSVGSIYVPWLLANNSISQGFGTLLSFGVLGLSIATIVYILLKDSIGGQSIGKRLLGCRVVSSMTGQPTGPAESCFRNMIFLVPFMVPVELIVSRIHSGGRRLGDQWAATQVVAGPPQWLDGILVVQEAPQKKHALDD